MEKKKLTEMSIKNSTENASMHREFLAGTKKMENFSDGSSSEIRIGMTSIDRGSMVKMEAKPLRTNNFEMEAKPLRTDNFEMEAKPLEIANCKIDSNSPQDSLNGMGSRTFTGERSMRFADRDAEHIIGGNLIGAGVLSSFLVESDEKLFHKGKTVERSNDEAALMPSMGLLSSFEYLESKPLKAKKKTEEKRKPKKQSVNKHPIRFQYIRVEGVPVHEIMNISITQCENDHTKLHLLQRYDEEEAESVVYDTMMGARIKVYSVDEEDETITLFDGTVADICNYYENNDGRIEINALSHSSQLDIYKQSRSYQDPQETYESTMDGLVKDTKGGLFFGGNLSKYTKNMPPILIQYKETNWIYLMRLASHQNEGLFVDTTVEYPAVYIGPDDTCMGKIKPISCRYRKDIEMFQKEQQNYLKELTEQDYILYDIETYQYFRVGNQVEFQGKKLYVKEAYSYMDQAVLKNRYVLCSKNGLKIRKLFNENIQGLSINGTCNKSIRDKVKIQLNIDQEERVTYEFPYSTMSASPDGSGWYCMPEIGDLLRVYFPDHDESHCFAISSESAYQPDQGGGSGDGGAGGSDGSGAGSGAGGSQDMMADPKIKYLRTADNKEIKMTPDGITINADNGKAMIAMDNVGNITISGAKTIQMNASNDVNITAAKNVTMMASENLKISGAAGTIELTTDGNTKLTGEYVLEN